MPISSKQQKILAFPYTAKYQALICDGAVRTGKTSLMTVSFVDWAMREFNNTNFAICGKTVGSAIKNIIKPYMALTYAKKRYSIKFTRSDNTMTVKRGDRVNTFYIYGGKDESSYMLIQGITLAGCLLDEVALMTQSFVEEALARCLTFPNRRYWFNCNPDTPMHWFYKEWILQAEKHKVLHLHFLMTDNPALTEETIKQAEQDFSGVFYDRKVLGRWVIAEGLVYSNFNTELHVVPVVPKNEKGQPSPRRYTEYQISCDYGTFNPFCALLWGLYGGVWYCIKEYWHDGRAKGVQLDDEQYFNALCAFAGDLPISRVLVDPSASSFITHARRRGKYDIIHAKNDVLDGIRSVQTALNTGKIKICEACTNLIREFGLYSWNEKATEDTPIKENDHSMDACRYFVFTNRIALPDR